MENTLKLTPLAYRVYDFLKANCIGEANSISMRDLAEAFDVSERTVRRCIHDLKNSDKITRKIGSSYSGYYMIVSNNNPSTDRMIKSQISSRIKTAINNGVSVKWFYSLLNSLDDKIVQDQQQRLKVTPYMNTEVKTISDDLSGEEQ